jgi:hypothetical protein
MADRRIATTVDAQLERNGYKPDVKYSAPCPYCSETIRGTEEEHKEHEIPCRQLWESRLTGEKKLMPIEEQIRSKIEDVSQLPLAQSTAFRGEQLSPWQQDSFIGIIVQNHLTRTPSNIILPANLEDLTPELRDSLTGSNDGNYVWPRLAEVKTQMANGMLGPLVKFMPGGGKPFPDFQGRACVLLHCRYVYGEIDGSQQEHGPEPVETQPDIFDVRPDVKITRGADNV